MRKTILFLSLMAIHYLTAAQNSSAVFFSEKGEKFTVIMNGQRMNNEPQTNVRVDKLNAVPYVVKIIFENTAFGEVNEKVYLEDWKEKSFSVKERKVGDAEKGIKKMGAGIGYHFKEGGHEEHKAKVDSIENSNSKYVIRLISIADIQAPGSSNNAVKSSNTQVSGSASGNTTTGTTQVKQSTTTTTTGGSATVNDNGRKSGISMNVNINAGGMENTSQSTQTTTTTTTTNSQQVYVMPGYNGPTGCNWPMNDGEFSELKATIASKTFEDSKFTIAKQVTKSRCMTASQVKEIAMLFEFENTKLDFAKYAYDYTFDIGNYFKVNDVFEFESSISDLNAYISARR